MKPITDIEDAKLLPEREAFDIIGHRQSDGTILKEILFRDLVAVERDDKAILMFVDSDGRLMSIDYDSEGAFKRKVRL